jgi:hypothetical protein
MSTDPGAIPTVPTLPGSIGLTGNGQVTTATLLPQINPSTPSTPSASPGDPPPKLGGDGATAGDQNARLIPGFRYDAGTGGNPPPDPAGGQHGDTGLRAIVHSRYTEASRVDAAQKAEQSRVEQAKQDQAKQQQGTRSAAEMAALAGAKENLLRNAYNLPVDSAGLYAARGKLAEMNKSLGLPADHSNSYNLRGRETTST